MWKIYLELGLALATNPSGLAGDNPLGIFRLGAERGSWVVEYEHQSSVPDGPPFNHRMDERWQERVGIYYRIKF